MISSFNSSLLNVTQSRMNLTINTSTEVNIIGRPKKVIKKLAKFRSERKETETEDESEKRRQGNIGYLITHYQYCFPVTGDGNELYRIVGINLIRNLIVSQSRTDEFLAGFRKKVGNAGILRNHSVAFQEFCKMEKLMQTIRTCIRCHQKKPMGSFDRGMAYLLNNYPIFDFSLIAICRLYTYYYAKVDIKHNQYTEFEDFIVDYNVEPTSEIVKLMSECFKVEIHIYSISPDVEVMHYLPNIRGESEPISIMQIRNKYLILEKKGEYVKENIVTQNSQHTDSSRTNEWVLETKDSQRSMDSPFKIDFKKKAVTSSIVFEARNAFHKPTRQSEEPRLDSPNPRQSMKLSKISKVESEYRMKIMTPPQQEEECLPRALALHKLDQMTIFPQRQQSVEPPKPTLEHYGSLKSFARTTVGKIRKQFMSPPVSNRSQQMVPEQRYELSKMCRIASKPSLQDVNQPYHSTMHRRLPNKRIVIHTEDFQIEVLRK